MDEPVVVSAPIPADLHAQLGRVARDHDQSESSVVVRALERYLAEEIDLLDSIAEAEADFAAGRVYTHEQVKEMFGLGQGSRDAA